MSEDIRVVTFRIPLDLYTKIREVAQKNERKIGPQVVYMLKEILDRQERQEEAIAHE